MAEFKRELAGVLGGELLEDAVREILGNAVGRDWAAFGDDPEHPELLRLHVSENVNLHIWGGTTTCDGVVHSHIRGFRSAVVAGQLTEWVYEEDPDGELFEVRLTGRKGGGRVRTRSVRMSVTGPVIRAADSSYERGLSELHLVEALDGTVTVQRFHGPESLRSRRTIATRRPGYGSPAQGWASPEVVGERATAALSWWAA